MQWERLPRRVLCIWEVLGFAAAALLYKLALWAFAPYTWFWYLILWLLGAAYVLLATWYLPFLYLNTQFGISDRFFVVKKGVFFYRQQYLLREQIAFVTVYRNPLTPLCGLATLSVSAPGSRCTLPFLRCDTARELASRLSREHTGRE